MPLAPWQFSPEVIGEAVSPSFPIAGLMAPPIDPGPVRTGYTQPMPLRQTGRTQPMPMRQPGPVPVPLRQTGRTQPMPMRPKPNPPPGAELSTLRISRDPPQPLPPEFAPVTFMWGETAQALPNMPTVQVELSRPAWKPPGPPHDDDVDTSAQTLRLRRRR